MFSHLIWGSLSFLRSSEHEGSRVVVKKLSHRPGPFGYGGVRVTFQLPYNSTTHITVILVCVYKYMRSVTFVTLGNKGHGSGPCVRTLRKEIKELREDSLEELRPVYPVLTSCHSRLSRKAQSGTRKTVSHLGF